MESRSSSRETRIRLPTFFGFVYLSRVRNPPNPKRVEKGTTGGPRIAVTQPLGVIHQTRLASPFGLILGFIGAEPGARATGPSEAIESGQAFLCTESLEHAGTRVVDTWGLGCNHLPPWAVFAVPGSCKDRALFFSS